jgi:signal transduction histidine kinase
VGARRQAFYSDLRPGRYRFRVIACNADGVWNESGAAIEFSILPSFYQRPWFACLCITAALALLWLLYRFRLRQIARALNERFEERVAERTRLARELHDTLLQTLQGSKLFADISLRKSLDVKGMRDTIESLSDWLGRAIAEVRISLNSLRASPQEGNLAEALLHAAEDCRQGLSMYLKFEGPGPVESPEPKMHLIAREEIFRIGSEAILNACRHSQASVLEVKLRYFPDLSLTIHDNGKGMDPDIAAHGKAGHFGLQGIRERSQRINGALTIVSEIGAGTTIELVVPAKIVFPSNNWRSLLAKAGLTGMPTDEIPY